MRYAISVPAGALSRAQSRAACARSTGCAARRGLALKHTHAPGRVGMSFHRFGMTLSPSFTVFEFLT